MAAIIYYVREVEPGVLEIAKCVQVVGAKRPRFESEIFLHEDRHGGWHAYFKERTHSIPLSKVFADAQRVIGDTYDVKELLKMEGFKWNSLNKSWEREISNEDIAKMKQNRQRIQLAKEFIREAGDEFAGEYQGHYIDYKVTERDSIQWQNKKGFLVIDGKTVEFDTTKPETLEKMGELLEILEREEMEK